MKCEPLLYSREQAAKMLNISTVTLDRHVKYGNLLVNRVGRRRLFSRWSLDTFVTRRTQELQ